MAVTGVGRRYQTISLLLTRASWNARVAWAVPSRTEARCGRRRSAKRLAAAALWDARGGSVARASGLGSGMALWAGKRPRARGLV